MQSRKPVPSLGAALLAYRREHALTQAQLGELLGFHQSYISLLEMGRRQIRDVVTLERVAQQIGWRRDVASPFSMQEHASEWSVSLAWSVVRLADAARASGRPLVAARELWPLVQRLHAAPMAWCGDSETMRLAASATLSFATALGHVMSQERLNLVLTWSDRALTLAQALDDDVLSARALRSKGNELRKAGHVREAMQVLRRSAAPSSNPADRGTSAALLARAAAEAGDATCFQEALMDANRLLASDQFTSVFNPYALEEIQLRGLVRLHRLPQALDLLRRSRPVTGAWVTPQWRVLRLITEGHAAVALRDADYMADRLCLALSMSEEQHLSRQIQRVLHVLALAPAGEPRARLRDQARAALDRLRAPAALHTWST